MNRDKFLSITGLSFLGAMFFGGSRKNAPLLTECNDPITPAVPIGPYYKDEKLNRAAIAEHKKGTAITYHIKVEDKACRPVQGAIVDIWQCDADGHYSDFEQEHTAGQTWLRGYQVTNEKGECMFTSIFPGWYTGRLTHVHAKVHIAGKDVLTTNFFFPKAIEEEVFGTTLYPKGINPTTQAQDFELHDDKDTSRRDALVMQVTKQANGSLAGKCTIALA
ncbi:hypothetical protein I5907_07185 [Panacibacter sp. DH6]|uniref:Intradiol ring-cleavage dioxygenases domain-containing protein n=1 Tax=Panacibacter microcysteis TaxID=2793269 RepID=A0A931DZV8_9BACT|nr:hypothetical protein [Panacibacter microcysteis]MBG9376012.1 hypothetical protein [Panacibacter microcysteis]